MTENTETMPKKIEFSSATEILHFQKTLSDHFINHQLLTPAEATRAMMKSLAVKGFNDVISSYHIPVDINTPTDHVKVTTIGNMLNQEMVERGFENVKITGAIMNRILVHLGYQTKGINFLGEITYVATEKGTPYGAKDIKFGSGHQEKEETKDGVTTKTKKNISFDAASLIWRPMIVEEINPLLFADDPYETLLEWIPFSGNKEFHKRVHTALDLQNSQLF